MKVDFSKAKDQAQKMAKGLGEKAYDVAAIAVDKGKIGVELGKEKYDVAKREMDVKRLSPIFREEISNVISNTEPFLIRLVDADKKRQDAEVCIGSVGFFEKIKGIKVLHIYTSEADSIGMNFFPCAQDGLFCPNPFVDNMFIELDDYFDYIKKAKVDELETIAHKLGATYVKISFKEKKTYFTEKKKKMKVKADKYVEATVDDDLNEEAYSDVKVAAEVEFEGCPWPVEPEVVYFKNISDVLSLINIRMDVSTMNEIKSKTYTFEQKIKKGINRDTALKIDTVIKGLKCSGNGTVTSKVESEERTILEYVVKF